VTTAAPARPGPVHVTGELLATKRVGAYHHLTLVAPGVAERFRPGTFVAVSVSESRLARRAFWIHRVKPVGGYGPVIEVVVEATGPGSTWLAGLGAGARVEVTGPLGRGFSLPQEPVSCVLVGEGYAAAPLFPLAERLRERDCPVTLLVTGDGSVGRKGTVADVVPEVLDRARAEVVYAAGPVATLHAVAQAAEHAGAWSQTALATPLPCATGLCHGCGVPVVGELGAAQVVRGCVEGPVIRGDRVRWEALFAPVEPREEAGP
jgi:dihydroorotate dehydrogenase electron transfer subunit